MRVRWARKEKTEGPQTVRQGSVPRYHCLCVGVFDCRVRSLPTEVALGQRSRRYLGADISTSYDLPPADSGTSRGRRKGGVGGKDHAGRPRALRKL